ncbi:MAG: SDR family oxidoreductase [Deltaproteobacteria bacterium]|nr:SDR family oxidoreductase [Deltaproteobacteria bacterium]
MKIKNKVALVLGSIKGIGRGIGLELARQGARLALTHYDWEESLDEMKQDFAASGVDHLIVRINLLETESIPGLIQKVIDRFGRLDILINNIERGGWPVVHGPYVKKQWDLEMATTLRAKQWVFDSALPHLKASGNGLVINLSSIAAIVGRSGPAAWIFNDGYAAANRGISLLTETWARLGAPRVRVNEIMLGVMDTRHGAGTRGWNLLSREQKQSLIEHTLLQRTGTIDDVVRAVCFIIKDAPFMTGSVLRLDGGYILGSEKIAPMPAGVITADECAGPEAPINKI